jgi:hypothetical protein
LACAAASAAGAPVPFRRPAADSPLGEHFLDVVGLVSASGFASDARPARFPCGLTFRLGAPRADGSINRAGFLGGTADVMDCALRLQAPWLEAARGALRENAQLLVAHIASRLRLEPVVRTTSLIRAAFAGDEQRVRELLAAGAPLQCVDSDLKSALHRASERGNKHVVAALLAADATDAKVDAQDDNGETPLLIAADWCHASVVELLCAALGAVATLTL